MATFGKDIMQKEFMLDYKKSFLNQGSYGSAPRRVLDHRKMLIDTMEEQPDAWFKWTYGQRWTDSVAAAADFLNSDPKNLVFVNNTTTGINSVLRSLDLKKGDGILLYAWSYFSVINTADYVAMVKDLEVHYVNIIPPLTSVDQLLEGYEDMLRKHENIKIVVIDHIASVPAALMPISRLIALCRQYNKLVLIDGAHAPGQIDLHLEQIGADFYVGNLHKWAYAPRGCAILWVDPKFHKQIFPVVTSNLHLENTLSNFSYLGTADYTTYNAVSESVKFYRDIGGFNKISQYCEALLAQGCALLIEKWGTKAYALPREMDAPFMKLVRIPDMPQYPHVSVDLKDYKSRITDITDMNKEIWEKFGVQSTFMTVENEPYCRVSASVFCELDDYRKLADAVLELRDEGLKNVKNSQ